MLIGLIYLLPTNGKPVVKDLFHKTFHIICQAEQGYNGRIGYLQVTYRVNVVNRQSRESGDQAHRKSLDQIMWR